MSLEHSPAKQHRAAAVRSAKALDEMAVAEDLLLGAGPIAFFIYGENTPESRRNVYRNPFGFSFFKHGNTIAALKSTIRAEVVEAQQAAREKRQRLKESPPKPVIKRRARRAR